jgi:hypothetical protein
MIHDIISTKTIEKKTSLYNQKLLNNNFYFESNRIGLSKFFNI